MTVPKFVSTINFNRLLQENLQSAKKQKKEELRNFISGKLGLPSQVVNKNFKDMLKRCLMSGFLNLSEGEIVMDDIEYQNVKYYLCRKCLRKFNRAKKLFRTRSSRARQFRKMTKKPRKNRRR